MAGLRGRVTARAPSTPSPTASPAATRRARFDRRANAPATLRAAIASAAAATAATAGTSPSRTLGEPASRPVARPTPPSARNPTLARLVNRKKATVRRAMNWVDRPPRRRIHAPSARPPAPPTESTEFAASSDNPISVLVRQLIRRQKTPRNTSTYPAQEPICSAAASTSQPGWAPAKRSRRDASPGTRTITPTTTSAITPTVNSERRSLDGENSSGSPSASTSGSRYSTVKVGLALMPSQPTLREHGLVPVEAPPLQSLFRDALGWWVRSQRRESSP